MRGFSTVAGAVCLLGQLASAAVTVDFKSDQSIKDGASTIAFGLLKFYTGNNTGDVPGNLPDPYFSCTNAAAGWEAGALFGTMVDYWLLTGDSTYNDVTTQALLHQAGEDADFMPRNQTRTEGNDDQGFWAMAAMSAAENNFPNPPKDQPQWLALSQAVFNQYVSRWDMETCGGGLRWQIFTFNNGFNYKNSISNGCFFNIAARLARFTGNQTYAEWAERVWDWEVSVGLITPDFKIYDGATVDNGKNCKQLDTIQWSYNAGIFLHGAAVMYNLTSDKKWLTRTEGVLKETTGLFFNQSAMTEQACEPFTLCDIDQQSFKGYLTRWMAGTAQVVPQLFDQIMALLKPNAEAAISVCNGPSVAGFKGKPGTACGFKWNPKGQFDGQAGVGPQMNALDAAMYMLIKKADVKTAPVTADTGGTSVGNPNAGMSLQPKIPTLSPIETKDKVAAGFATSAVVLSIVAGCVFLMK
ncbi:mannan endo-alpha-mannosidase dcw1 [Colletotrichum plurivorum]|uniref:Mannan endo-1,6-alpha-mannosidase n=1 Tax=Colletotrichum plurivorum TaxID=2175906 RepID=A0A8H6U685_9PEZI|nr:mannan endo-alpha-mannosidase dcw1 [Colletotrichum plurivorum]